MVIKYVAAAILGMAAFAVFAQVDVEDRALGQASSAATAVGAPSAASSAAGNNVTEMYYQMQILQQEVMQLRGLVDEQSNELKKLKQQRLDDYLDIDRRLSKLGSGGAPRGASSVDSAVVGSQAVTSSSAGAPENELAVYRNAIDLVLKKKDYDKAVVELASYLERYPKGRYAANAQYWLGEIHLLKSDLEQARRYFSELLRDFPEHRKALDAKFKLGKVYDLLGDKVTAKRLLQEVAATNSSAAKLAKDYLSANFPS